MTVDRNDDVYAAAKHEAESFIDTNGRALGVAGVDRSVVIQLDVPQPAADDMVGEPELETPPSKFQDREMMYIIGLFGAEMLSKMTTKDRSKIAFAINEMYFFGTGAKDDNYDIQAKRLDYFFSDMSFAKMSDIRAEEFGVSANIDNERTHYNQKKASLQEKFTPEQRQMILEFVLQDEPINWGAVMAVVEQKSVKRGPGRPKGAPSTPEKIATLAEAKAIKDRSELDLNNYDLFAYASNPPKDWQKDGSLSEFHDELLTAIIERAVRTTRLSDANANYIKDQLGLQVTAPINPNASVVSEYPGEYLMGEFARNPGRLKSVKKGDRISHMTATLRMFAEGHATLDQIVKAYGKNPEAGLLLKGAIAEVLMNSMRAAAAAKQ